MIRALLSSQPWSVFLLASALVPFALVWGLAWPNLGRSGVITLASLSLPMLLISLSGRWRLILTASALGVTGLLAEGLISGRLAGTPLTRLGLMLFAVLLAFSGLVACVVRLSEGERLLPLLRPARDRNRQSSTTAVPSEARIVQEPERELGGEEQDVQFDVLLEALEDIGRLISMNFDLDTLAPAIVSTAKSTLRCEECHVFLWDGVRKTLVNPLANDATQSKVFAPRVDRGIGAWVIRNRMVWTRERVSDPTALQAALAHDSRIPDAVAPLTAGMELLGLLVVDRAEAFSPNLEQMLYTLANIYGMGIRNAHLFRRLEEMARRDGLTGLYNHATFQQELRVLVRQAADRREPLSLIMSDIDYFKRFNDSYGHLAGDDVLRELARLWKAALPDSALLARYGGEEFIAALPGANEERAAELAEFLRISIAAHPFFSNGQEMSVTSSFGVAEFNAGYSAVDEFVRIADQSLYAAKNAGRNRVITASSVTA